MNLFRFHNSYHRFNRLIQIDLIFFSIAFSKWFFFRFHLSTLSLLEIRPCDFLDLFFMRLYQSHNSNYGFVRLTQVDFSYFLWSFLNRVSYYFFLYEVVLISLSRLCIWHVDPSWLYLFFELFLINFFFLISPSNNSIIFYLVLSFNIKLFEDWTSYIFFQYALCGVILVLEIFFF